MICPYCDFRFMTNSPVCKCPLCGHDIDVDDFDTAVTE